LRCTIWPSLPTTSTVRRGLAEREGKGYRITDWGKKEAVKVMARHPELAARQYDVVNRSSSYQASGGQP